MAKDAYYDVRCLCHFLFMQNGDTKETRKKAKEIYYKKVGRYTKDDPFLASYRWIPDPRDGFGEYGTERVVIRCGENDSAEVISEWFKEEHWVRISSPWDCTGEWFSQRVHAVKVSPTSAIVLHRMAMDI